MGRYLIYTLGTIFVLTALGYTVYKRNRKHTENDVKIKKYIPDIVVAIILIAGIGLLAYPTIGDYINALHSSKAIGSYVEKTKDLSKEEKENLLREAREYNESLDW